MGRFLCACAGVCVALATLVGSAASAAALEPGWPFTDPASTLVSYGASYASPGGGSSVHSGIDLTAPAGTSVLGVVAGRVTFAGRVPAGEGATTIAVTIESGDVRLTYMPLSEASVRAGDPVAAGQRLGALAASGDRSHQDPHLHLSARRGSLYVDPGAFLLMPVASGGMSEPQAAPSPSLALAEGAAAAVPEVGAPVAEPAPAPESVPRVQPQNSPVSEAAVPAAAAASATAPQSATAPSAPGVSPLQTAASEAIPSAASVQPATSVVPAAAAVLPDRTRAALATDRRALATAGAAPAGALVAVAAVLGAALLWPLWRAAPVLSVPVAPEQHDVAAVVAR